jgi:hypothetical protein
MLPQAGGPGPIGVLVHIIKNEDTNKVERQTLESSLAFDRHASAESVQAALVSIVSIFEKSSNVLS